MNRIEKLHDGPPAAIETIARYLDDAPDTLEAIAKLHVPWPPEDKYPLCKCCDEPCPCPTAQLLAPWIEEQP